MNCINGGHLHRFIILFLIFIGILLWILERGLGFLKKNTICGTVNCADIIVYVFFSRVSRRVEVSWRRVLIVFHLRKPTPRTTSVSYNVG